ncbi:MAG: O-antigen ligase family protein, partial [Candidatus Helarchaeota archaeon]
KVLFLKEQTIPSYMAIIFIGVCLGCLIIFGLWKFSFAVLLAIPLFLYLKKAEDLYLFWLFSFSLFSVNSLTFFDVEGHPILNYDRIFIFILFIFILLEIAVKKRKFVPPNNIEATFLILLIIFGFSIGTKSFWIFRGLRYYIDAFLLPFIIFFLSKNLILDKKQFYKFVNILFIVGIYISIMGVFEYITKFDLFPDPEYGGIRITENIWSRVNGPYINDHTFGFCVSMCFFIALYKYIILSKKKKSSNIIYFSIFLLMTTAIFLTFYRGIILSLVLGLVTFFIIRRKGLFKFGLIVIILTLFTVLFQNKIRSSELFNTRIANIKTIEDRIERYNYSFALFRENPIQGIGFRNYELLRQTTGQHNQIISMLSETGLLGTSVYILLTLFLFYYSIKYYKSSNGYNEKQFLIIYMSILVVYLALGLSDNSGFDKALNYLFFSISGVAMGRARKERLS